MKHKKQGTGGMKVRSRPTEPKGRPGPTAGAKPTRMTKKLQRVRST